jgi:hypothetical protein
MSAGKLLTDTILETLQPTPEVSVIETVPTATPVTIPVPEFTVAIAVFPLLHVPPIVVLVSDKVLPTHADSAPPIAAGVTFTEIVFV